MTHAGLAAALAECTSASDVAVACGLFHSAVLVRGRVFAFGRGAGGRLGQGDEANAQLPTPVPGLPADVAQVALGGLHSLFVTRSGELWSCGFGGFGALGSGDYKPRHAPLRVLAAPQRVALAAAGGAHSLALAPAPNDGADATGVWSWGRDEGDGRLGVTAAARVEGGAPAPLRVPLPAAGGSALPSPVVAAAAGGFHSLLLRADGGVLSFGANANGELGREGGTWVAAPVAALAGARVAQLAAGGFHSAALTADGELYTWGSGVGGALGHGTARNSRTPQRVGGDLAGVPLASVACGGASTLAVGRDGSVWAWGKNTQRMGSTSGDVLTPRLVPLPPGVRALSVAAGSAHAALLCAVDEESGEAA